MEGHTLVGSSRDHGPFGRYVLTALLGILPRLLSVLHSAGILTEDLSLSSDANDNLECSYRGLCLRPMKLGQDNQPNIRRRIGMSQRLVTGPGLIHHTVTYGWV